jgi:hypothetical protein
VIVIASQKDEQIARHTLTLFAPKFCPMIAGKRRNWNAYIMPCIAVFMWLMHVFSLWADIAILATFICFIAIIFLLPSAIAAIMGLALSIMPSQFVGMASLDIPIPLDMAGAPVFARASAVEPVWALIGPPICAHAGAEIVNKTSAVAVINRVLVISSLLLIK